MALDKVKIALLGCGTVGTQVARLLTKQSEILAFRAGIPLELVGIAVNNLDAPRDQAINRELLTTDAQGLIDSADLVIELIGGIELPRKLVLQALTSGKSVVTGNKALLATHGPELYEAAAQNQVDLYYEAAVAGAVPVVYGLRESLAGDTVTEISGIMNGTTNFILNEMTTKGMEFAQALKLAQDLGYAEADPTADVDGFDAAAKIAILASIAFHARVLLSDVDVSGIREISAHDIAQADAAGYVIKLIARARRYTLNEDGIDGVEVSVAPTMVPKKNPLASVDGAFNSVLVEAKAADRLMFYGRGAGGAPTASAVLSDVVAAAAKRAFGGHAPGELVFGETKILSAAETRSSYYLRLKVVDELGVLAKITEVFAKNHVSISAVQQVNARDITAVTTVETEATTSVLNVITHVAQAKDLNNTVTELKRLPEVLEVAKVLKVEGE
ncbi:MAG: homoserine dehydrogenase [Arcanobacterium sp.]|nr:homoserine dehydrogenase [Arcanobacterium sp.]